MLTAATRAESAEGCDRQVGEWTRIAGDGQQNSFEGTAEYSAEYIPAAADHLLQVKTQTLFVSVFFGGAPALSVPRQAI